MLKIVNDEGVADGRRFGSAYKVVQALDSPPSQRVVPAGVNAATPLSDAHIKSLYGQRFCDGWVAVFVRSGWGASLSGAGYSTRGAILEKVYFLVGTDIVGQKELMSTFERVDLGAAPDGALRTPYMMWHIFDKDTLWRFGVVPISEAQVPTNKKVINGGDANQTI